MKIAPEPAWKVYPTPLCDSELIRHVTGDDSCSVLERELALRLDRLLYAYDSLSHTYEPTEAELNGQLRLFN